MYGMKSNLSSKANLSIISLSIFFYLKILLSLHVSL